MYLKHLFEPGILHEIKHEHTEYQENSEETSRQPSEWRIVLLVSPGAGCAQQWVGACYTVT